MRISIEKMDALTHEVAKAIEETFNCLKVTELEKAEFPNPGNDYSTIKSLYHPVCVRLYGGAEIYITVLEDFTAILTVNAEAQRYEVAYFIHHNTTPNRNAYFMKVGAKFGELYDKAKEG